MPGRFVFHESLDSTRSTVLDPAHHPNLAQAQAEALVTLFLGRSLSVNNTYAFDSRSLLELADALLSTMNQVRKGASESQKDRLDAQRPIVVHVFGANDFFGACAQQLRRVTPGARFRLSAWQPIDHDDKARESLAAALHSAAPGPTWLQPDYPELEEQFDTLVRLDSYLKVKGRGRSATARTPAISLPEYVSHLQSLPSAEVLRIARERDCPEDLAVFLHGAVAGMPAEDVNRGWAHDAVVAARGNQAVLFKKEQVRELVDTLYNAVLADSAFAEFGYMTSVPRTDGRKELQGINRFAVGLIRDMWKKLTMRGSADPRDRTTRIEPTMSGVFTIGANAPHLPKPSLRQVFRAYWELVADNDRWQPWQDSCANLHRLLTRTDPVDNALRNAWSAHLATLETQVRGIVRTEQDNEQDMLAIETIEGRQTNQLEDGPAPSPDEVAVAGEYLDHMARGVAAQAGNPRQ